MSKTVIGIIGGSGLYEIDGLTNMRTESLSSPFGKPSADLMFGEVDGQQLVFLPRHGIGHTLSPSEINYRANIDVLKRAGVTEIISVSAVGSLREHLKPGMFVLVDQVIDRTSKRKSTFFENGCVAHVSMAHPVCSRLGPHIYAAAVKTGIDIVQGGTYLVMEGPQFSTLAESELYRSWNCDVIGMTNMPEAKLAREAEMCYASVAMVTDFDCWHPNHDDVTVEQIIKVLTDNATSARSLISNVVPLLAHDHNSHSCACHFSLDNAIITSPDKRNPDALKMLDAVAGRVL